MNSFTISKDNDYLKQDIEAYYHTKYTTMGEEGNPDYLNDLKNTYGKPDNTDKKDWAIREQNKLNDAVKKLTNVLEADLPEILKKTQKDSLSICVVPRSKSKSTYKDNQKLFKSTVESVIEKLNKPKDTANKSDIRKLDKFENAADYIVRTNNTKTTHLDGNTPNYKNDGKMPYSGITKETCTLDKNIKDKDILLIDDIYTAGVKIDEDAIQALMDKGAKSVIFYSVGACGI
jgi:phosphoribosylpyrophosphate synthetase